MGFIFSETLSAAVKNPLLMLRLAIFKTLGWVRKSFDMSLRRTLRFTPSCSISNMKQLVIPKPRTGLRGLIIALCIPLFVTPLCSSPGFGQTADTTGSLPADDSQQAVKQVLQNYVDHFNARDFVALAKLLDTGFKYRDGSTELDSPTALIAALQSLTAQEPTAKLEIEVQSIQLEAAQASVEGIAALIAENKPTERNSFTVAVNQSKDGWVISSIEETAVSSGDTMTADEAMASLTWLIGTWQDASDPTLISTVQQTPGNQFLQRTVERRTDDSTATVAIEMIGYDPQSHQVRSWYFFSDGSHATGTWRGAVDHCRIRLQQTLADGGTATGTYIVRPTSPDSMTVQIVSRVVNGELQPIGPTSTLTRINPTSAENTTTKTGSNP